MKPNTKAPRGRGDLAPTKMVASFVGQDIVGRFSIIDVSVRVGFPNPSGEATLAPTKTLVSFVGQDIVGRFSIIDVYVGFGCSNPLGEATSPL